MDTRKITTAVPRLLIRLYQTAALGRGRRCRFFPSCSVYMADALERHGLLRGLPLGLWRLLKCHPWHPGGYDPVKDETPLQPIPLTNS